MINGGVYDKRFSNVKSGSRFNTTLTNLPIENPYTIKVNSINNSISTCLLIKNKNGVEIERYSITFGDNYKILDFYDTTSIQLINTNNLTIDDSFEINVNYLSKFTEIKDEVSYIEIDVTSNAILGALSNSDEDYVSINYNDTLNVNLIDIYQGDIIKTNTTQSSTANVSHALLNDKMKIVKRLNLNQLNNYIISKDDVDLGAKRIAIHSTVSQSNLKTSILRDISTNATKVVLNPKKYILLGDSLLGQATDIKYRLSDMLKSKNVYNWGIGGSSWTYRSSDGSVSFDKFSIVNIVECIVTNDFSSMLNEKALIEQFPYFGRTAIEMSNFDFKQGDDLVIVISAGINDCSLNRQLGDSNSDNLYELNGAINTSVKKLITRLPKARIILTGTHYRVYEKTSSTENGIVLDSDNFINEASLKLIDYNDAIKIKSEDFRLEFFDLYRHGGRNRYNIFTICPDDGTHFTTNFGRQFQAELYNRILR